MLAGVKAYIQDRESPLVHSDFAPGWIQRAPTARWVRGLDGSKHRTRHKLKQMVEWYIGRSTFGTLVF